MASLNKASFVWNANSATETHLTGLIELTFFVKNQVNDLKHNKNWTGYSYVGQRHDGEEMNSIIKNNQMRKNTDSDKVKSGQHLTCSQLCPFLVRKAWQVNSGPIH